MRFLCFYYDEKKCFYANTTVKSSVLSPCIFTLKKKIHASELKHIKPNILSRTSKERTLIFYQHTQRQDNFSPLKNKLESRVNVKLINEWDYIQEGRKHILRSWIRFQPYYICFLEWNRMEKKKLKL